VAPWCLVEALLIALSALAVSVVSAVTQVLPVEAYLAGLGLVGAGAGLWLVALFAGVGHGLGKMAWYEVGRVAHRSARFRRWLERPRVRASYTRWLAEFERRPRLVLLMVGASALLGLPPLAVIPTIAGQVRASRLATFVCIAGGRTLRFAVLLGAVGWLAGLA
jgi:membrane protein YqaA with SNARE-associated domain